MLFDYSYLQNNGQKTKWLIQITKDSRYESDQRERVINPELFGFKTLFYCLTTPLIPSCKEAGGSA